MVFDFPSRVQGLEGEEMIRIVNILPVLYVLEIHITDCERRNSECLYASYFIPFHRQR